MVRRYKHRAVSIVDLGRVQHRWRFGLLLLQTQEDVAPFVLHSRECQVLGALESVSIRVPGGGKCNRPDCLRFEVGGRPLFPRARTERW